MFIRRLLGFKPRTQAELDAFIEKNRIDREWRHQKQVHKELKAHHKQEYVDRHKKRTKMRRVYFRQEADKTILYDSAGLAIAELSTPTYRPLTLTSTVPDAQQPDARTNLDPNNIESAATQGINNPLILEGQDSASGILPDPAPSTVEPSQPEPAQENCDISHEREARGTLALIPAQSLSSRDPEGPISLSHADQVPQPTTSASESGNPANCQDDALSVLSLEPSSPNPLGADASRTHNSPEQSMTHYQGTWSDGLTTALPISDGCEGSGTSNRHCGEANGSEIPPTIPDASNIFSTAPFDPVDATFRVPIAKIGSSANFSIAREADAQFLTIASPRQSAGPSQDPKGKGKAETEPEAVSLIGFPSAFETELIQNPQYAGNWQDLSIWICFRLLVINKKAFDNCWVCQHLQYAISWTTMIFTKSL